MFMGITAAAQRILAYGVLATLLFDCCPDRSVNMVDVFVEDGYNFVTINMKKSSEHVE